MYKDKIERLKYTDKAKDILSRLTLEEKVSLMSGTALNVQKEGVAALHAYAAGMRNDETHYNITPLPAGGIEKEGVPPLMFSDGPRGAVDGNGETTCFPVSMARGATFDTKLEEEIGHAVAKEVRAFGANYYSGICINLPYNPGWGRCQETYGEESFHLGAMGSALVRGVQEEGVIACIKHFAFNQMENARFKVSVTCDQRTEKEVFLPHFKDCIDAGAASVMSSYNRYNGYMCGHNKYLLTEVLKNEWDFDGFVTSDHIFGVKDTIESVMGGQDVEMPFIWYYGDRLVKAVQDGFVPMEKIDEAALRIIRTLIAFDDGHPTYDKSVLASPSHVALSRRAAEESITLVKNDKVLPLKKQEVKKIALIGRLADVACLGDKGSSQVRPPYTVTVREGLSKANPAAEILYTDGTDLETAQKYAAEADACIFTVGYDFMDEGEFVSPNKEDNYLGAVGGDRAHLGLHPEDVALIQKIGPVNKKSIVILIGGSMIMMTDWIDKVDSVLMAYYPGMEGGNAVADIIYGDVNPSGKLPFVVPVSEDDLPFVDWEATDQYYEYYHGYARLDKNGVKPLFPYGYGLSYTTFGFFDVKAWWDKDELVASVKVKNTGDRSGAEVVQLYVGFEGSAVDRPIRQLRGFKRISLDAGSEETVEIRVSKEKLKYYEPTTRKWVLEDVNYIVYIGDSEDPTDLISTKLML